MGESHVTIGKSFDEVVRNSAMKITEDYTRAHGESMRAAIIRSTGQPIDHSCPVPLLEVKLYVNGFASGVANVLAAVLTGKLDLSLIKKEICAGKDDEEPTP